MPDVELDEDSEVRFRGRLYVPEEAHQAVLSEAHRSRYVVHLSTTKMYHCLRRFFWWPGMKWGVAEFVARCLTCQQVKVEHQRPGGELQPLPIPE